MISTDLKNELNILLAFITFWSLWTNTHPVEVHNNRY